MIYVQVTGKIGRSQKSKSDSCTYRRGGSSKCYAGAILSPTEFTPPLEKALRAEIM